MTCFASQDLPTIKLSEVENCSSLVDELSVMLDQIADDELINALTWYFRTTHHTKITQKFLKITLD